MKKIALVFFLFLLAGSAYAQNLSEQATISVITCGPSQDVVYLAFGHSAFRVHDPQAGFDYAFNYGIFDFDQPNFLLNFALGNNFYMLGVQDYPRFREAYIGNDRFLHEQLLDLSPSQKQKIFDYLLWNAQPENRSYRYDYFYDNCATRIRDVITTVLGSDVTFDGSYVKTDYTIRQLTDLYLGPQPWGDLGIDVCLGLPMDKKATPYEYMFLPDYIESGFDHATVKHDSTSVPIVKNKTIVYESQGLNETWSFPHPFYVFSVLLLIGLAFTVRDYRRKKLSNWFDLILFSLTGIIGVLLFLLWFFTDHKAAANNFNILWALPTHIVAVIAYRKKPSWLKTYFLVSAGIEGLLLITWTILPQQLNTALLPVVVLLGVRAFIQYRVRSQVV